MKDKRFSRYLYNKRNGQPIKTKEEVSNNPDNKIDQDFPGFPHGTAQKELITPSSKKDEKASSGGGRLNP